MKEKLLKVPIFFLFVTGVLCALRTAAYFSDYDDKMNTAAVGSVITEIDEDFPDPTPTPMGDNLSLIHIYRNYVCPCSCLYPCRRICNREKKKKRHLITEQVR